MVILLALLSFSGLLRSGLALPPILIHLAGPLVESGKPSLRAVVAPPGGGGGKGLDRW
jgi:hypothetical protein